MQATADRLEFGPPPPPGFLRALGLAVIAHALLLAALGWGVSWKNQTVTLSAEAELWSAVPQQAAPKLVEAPRPPPPEPVIAPKVITPPPPAPEVAPKLPDADIALERDKQRLLKEKLLKEQKLAERDRQEKREKLEKLAIEKKRLEDKRELDKKLAADKKKADLNQTELKAAEQKKAVVQAQEEARNTEIQRQENIKRMAGLAGVAGVAGATGASTATGTALQASGPSPSYGGRIRARIKPNIVFTEDIATNPTAEVEVRTSPDGTIISRKLLKTSGTASWDAAVLKAIDKTETLPRDVDGRVPPSLVISFRPKD
jgi:colicin import membrane protein